jgi:hypothetical protein
MGLAVVGVASRPRLPLPRPLSPLRWNVLIAAANAACVAGSTDLCLTLVLAGCLPRKLSPLQFFDGRIGLGTNAPRRCSRGRFQRTVRSRERTGPRSSLALPACRPADSRRVLSCALKDRGAPEVMTLDPTAACTGGVRVACGRCLSSPTRPYNTLAICRGTHWRARLPQPAISRQCSVQDRSCRSTIQTFGPL